MGSTCLSWDERRIGREGSERESNLPNGIRLDGSLSPVRTSQAFRTKLTIGHEAPMEARSQCPMRLALEDSACRHRGEVAVREPAVEDPLRRLTTR